MMHATRSRHPDTTTTAILVLIVSTLGFFGSLGPKAMAAVESPADAAAAADTARAEGKRAETQIERLETEALDFTSRGRYRDALEPLARAFELAARAASADPSGPRGRLDAATAEALFVLLDETIRQDDAFPWGRETLSAWLVADWLDMPLLEARMRFVRGRYNAAKSGSGTGWFLADELGFLTDWQVIGPFDNEQGSGFGRVFPPEGELDLDATYPAKARDASWRRLPARVGLVPLETLFHPRTHALAYAVTTVDIERDTDVAFRLGSDESIKVWIDGALVFERDVRRPCRFDQDAFGVRLRAGHHRILVKVATQTGGWAFAMRLTDPAGRPLVGWTQDATRVALMTQPEPEGTGASLEVESIDVDKGALATFRALLADESGDIDASAAVYRRATILYLHLAPDDPTDRSPYRFASTAARLAPRDAHAHFLLARSSTPPIKMRPELEENERRRHLETALRIDPGHARAALDLAAHYLDSIELPDRSLEFCDRAIAASPDNLHARIARIRALEWKNLYGLADAERKKMADGPNADSPRVLVTRAARLTRRGRVADAAELLEQAHAIDRASTGVRRSLIQVLERSGRRERALALVDEELRGNPLSIQALAARARMLEAARDLAGAQRALEQALVIAPQNPDSVEIARPRATHPGDGGPRPHLVRACARTRSEGPLARNLPRVPHAGDAAVRGGVSVRHRAATRRTRDLGSGVGRAVSLSAVPPDRQDQSGRNGQPLPPPAHRGAEHRRR